MRTSAKWIGLAVVLALAGQASAGVVVYTNQASYLAATTGLTTVDFNGIAPTGSFVGYGNGPLTLSGVTFSSNADMFVIDPAFYGAPYTGGGFLNADYASPADVLTAALPGSYTAIGMNYGGLFSSGGAVDFTFTLSDGSTYTTSTSSSVSGGSLDFIGVTSSTAIVSVTISMPDVPTYNAIDNFSFGNTVVTPEPATITSLGIAGLIGLVGYYRRRTPAVV